MKNMKSLIAVLFGAFLLGSCAGNLTDLNVDPNNPTDVPAENLVTQAELALYALLHSRGYNAEWTMLCVQQWSQNEYCEESRYTVDGNDFDFEFTTFYASVLAELQAARGLIEDSELPAIIAANQIGIIEILSVDAFAGLTDGYGAVPYTQALNGTDFPNPQYDSQESIYRDLLARLDAAVQGMDESSESFANGDVIYGGNVASWKRLGASLMMRYAMRVADVDNALASEYITKAANYGVLQSNSDNALLVFSSDPSIANPLYIDNVIDNRDDFCVSDVLVQTLQGLGDPRLEAFAAPNLSGEYKGMPYGLLDGDAFALKDQTSRPSDAVREATAPHVIMDYAEVAFLTAEAYQRGLLSGDAASAYAEGVTASMNYWGIADQAAIDAYVAANPYDGANWKQSLGVQKWLAFYMNGPQAWAEWRRLDYPQLEVPAAATNDVIPVRLPYPISEQTRNEASLQAVTGNPNDMNTKMWWDVN